MTEPNRHPDIAAADSTQAQPDSPRDPVDSAEQDVLSMINEARERLEPLNHWVRATTSEHPYLVLCSAASLSFLAGFLIKRRTALGIGAALGFLAGCWLATSQPQGSWDAPMG